MITFIRTKQFITVENELYEIIRAIRESHNPVIDTWKESLMADKVFKRGNFFFFCKHIEDAVIVEDEVIGATSEEKTPETLDK